MDIIFSVNEIKLQQTVFVDHLFTTLFMCVNEMDIEKFFSKQATHFLKELFKENLSSKKSRKDFSESVKNQVLALQFYRCNYCKMVLEAVNFDHIDGDSSNNLLSNCQALCPNCHAKKTRKSKK